MREGYWRTLASIEKQGTLYNTYTTAKSMLTSATAVTGVADAAITLPPGFFYPGKTLHIFGVAGISNRVTGPDTFTPDIRVGAVVAFNGGAINLTTTAHTTIPAWFDFLLTCDTAGNGTLAKLRGQSKWSGQMIAQLASAADNAGGTGKAMAPNTAPALGTGFDSTVANVLDFFVAQSVSNAGNGFQLWEYTVADLVYL